MLKAVLFDMDGVIVDTEPLHHKAYQMMFDDVGIMCLSRCIEVLRDSPPVVSVSFFVSTLI